MNDNDILELYFNREESAIAVTAEKYGNYCYAVAYNILHNSEDSEECVSDTYLSAWNTIPPKHPSRLATYLGKITRNFSLDRYRKYNSEKRSLGQGEIAFSELEECISDNQNPESIFEEKAVTEALNKFLYAQPTQKRNIFIRRYWYFYSVKDIAKAYGISESKVSSVLFRMRKELKSFLEKEGLTL